MRTRRGSDRAMAAAARRAASGRRHPPRPTPPTTRSTARRGGRVPSPGGRRARARAASATGSPGSGPAPSPSPRPRRRCASDQRRSSGTRRRRAGSRARYGRRRPRPPPRRPSSRDDHQRRRVLSRATARRCPATSIAESGPDGARVAARRASLRSSTGPVRREVVVNDVGMRRCDPSRGSRPSTDPVERVLRPPTSPPAPYLGASNLRRALVGCRVQQSCGSLCKGQRSATQIANVPGGRDRRGVADEACDLFDGLARVGVEAVIPSAARCACRAWLDRCRPLPLRC